MERSPERDRKRKSGKRIEGDNRAHMEMRILGFDRNEAYELM